jgi:lipoprotein-anchoring transpeptidase ErfK/SrfK
VGLLAPLLAAPVGATTSPQVGSGRVILAVTATSLVAGESLTATVVVLPRSAGRTVVIERRGSLRWRNIDRATTNREGRTSIQVAFKTPGQYEIRAAVTPNALSGGATSTAVSIDVTPVPAPYATTTLAPGDSGPLVVDLQQRLSALGYWVGTPNGYFGDATEQAVYAVQKAAGINPDGTVGPKTVAALEEGVLPHPRSTHGTVVEIDLHDDLIMFVHNGTVTHVLNTSTGGGYTYTEQGVTDTAITPTGVFHIYRTFNGLVTDPLGKLWRPRFFYEGFAIHGDTYVPPEPVSHGCARISIEAIDWIWADNLLPIGTEVWVY